MQLQKYLGCFCRPFRVVFRLYSFPNCIGDSFETFNNLKHLSKINFNDDFNDKARSISSCTRPKPESGCVVHFLFSVTMHSTDHRFFRVHKQYYLHLWIEKNPKDNPNWTIVAFYCSFLFKTKMELLWNRKWIFHWLNWKVSLLFPSLNHQSTSCRCFSNSCIVVRLVEATISH